MTANLSRKLSLAAAAGLALAAALAAFNASGQAGERTVRDGVFSAAQVERGKDAFAWICTDCHEIDEFTAPRAYLEEMDGESLWDVFEYVWAEMPEDNPASLEPEEYADVLAYVLSVYGLPTGPNDMPTDKASLEQITVVRPERPGS